MILSSSHVRIYDGVKSNLFFGETAPNCFLPFMILRARLEIVIKNMAPHPGVDTEEIREKAGKVLLHLLEGVCKAESFPQQVAGAKS